MTDTDAETPERWDAPSAGPARALKPEKPCPAQGSFILEPIEPRDFEFDSDFGSDSGSDFEFADDPESATEPPRVSLPREMDVGSGSEGVVYARRVSERLIEMRAALHDLLEFVDADDALCDLRAASGD
ncbi:MAG: hypothetical protein IPK13_17950 [Deltaproteobacteria bacterium]|nr:hypothetical protein [Deltaproteobacteria bacterium]